VVATTVAGQVEQVGLPPGPRLPVAVQTLLAVFATERYTDWCVRRYGGAVTLRVAGLDRFVSFSDPEMIREVFTGDRDVLRAGEANRVIGLNETSVVVADGERHLRLRRLLLPPFHGEAVRRHAAVMRELALADVERWPVGRPFAVHDRMQAITLEAILRLVVGVRDPGRAERLRRALPAVLGVSLMALFAENGNPRLFATRPAQRLLPWLRARRVVNALLDEEIAAHRADPGDRDDVLAMLMATQDEQGDALTDEEVRDQLLTLLVPATRRVRPRSRGASSASSGIRPCSPACATSWPAATRTRTWARSSTRRCGSVRWSTRSPAARRAAHPRRPRAAGRDARGRLDPRRPALGRVRRARPVPPRALPRLRRPVLRPHPVRRRRAPLHRGELRRHGDEGGPPRGPRARRARDDDRATGTPVRHRRFTVTPSRGGRITVLARR
jgi:hypothetical protein